MITKMRQQVRDCTICQLAKYEPLAYPGLLQLLPIPSEVWKDISMDFITGLPPSRKNDTIFVVVDRFSKSAHFMALAHPYTAVQVAQCYLDNVFKLHGWPRSIVGDRDSIFPSHFCESFIPATGH